MHWWRRAALQGHIHGRFNLAVTLFEGIGVPKDKVEAYAWIKIVLLQTDNASIRDTRDRFARSMTSVEIAKAQKLLNPLRTLSGNNFNFE